MIKICIFVFFVGMTYSQTDLATPSTSNTNSYIEERRGGYGGDYSSGGYGNGGYGGGHGHGSISLDAVSVLGLLSLGAVLLRSILTLLTSSARSLDVTDINLPLMLSDIPEAIVKWHGMTSTHVVHERSMDDQDDEDNPVASIRQYLNMLTTEKACLPHFLCRFWKIKSMEEDSFLDLVMLATAVWNGHTKSAAIYDHIKKPDSLTAEQYCIQARSECPAGHLFR
ncbi:uncharacterized protein LOC130696365 [Daphnia carinata]|uniref:uncharacterized protein LOC130696365 n=1 Tax=Daphnia carinata TaxID=120202 RepID=UPI00257C5850|nr:uncharacterized protein LOC130696365 [Daphnia carinata]